MCKVSDYLYVQFKGPMAKRLMKENQLPPRKGKFFGKDIIIGTSSLSFLNILRQTSEEVLLNSKDVKFSNELSEF